MRLTPSLSTKPLNACKFGELVRVPWTGYPLCLVAKHRTSSQTYAVVLEGEVGGRPPRFIPCNDDTQSVLSYGTEYEIELHLDGPNELRASQILESNGAILVANGTSYMCVAPNRTLGTYTALYFDLTNFELAPIPTGSLAAFANWTLSIWSGEKKQRRILVEFKPSVG
jgi:hypothetical protein